MIPPNRSLVAAIGLAYGISSAPLHAESLDLSLPDLGDTSTVTVSETEQHRIGQAFYRKLRKDGLIETDPVVAAYIEHLGEKLVSAAHANPAAFTFFGVRDSAINAFAAPGGFIGVNEGLLRAMQSEAELAAVMAHEIAHVTQHHLVRHFEATANMGLGVAAAILAAILVGGTTPAVKEALIYGSMGANARASVNFTRRHEQEADRVGIEYLQRAGYPGYAMANTFKRLDKLTRQGGRNAAPEFLRTHPVNARRIAEATRRARSTGAAVVEKSHPSVRFELIKALIEQRSTLNQAQHEAALRQSLQTGRFRNEYATRFALALALEAQEKYQAAENVISALLEDDNNRDVYHLTQARLLTALNRPDKARATLQTAVALFPNNLAVRLALARHWRANHERESAYREYRKLVKDFPANPILHKELAQAAFALDRVDEAHLEQAEAAMLNDRLDAAKQSLDLAAKAPSSDDAIAERIAQRLHELHTVETKATGFTSDQSGKTPSSH